MRVVGRGQRCTQVLADLLNTLEQNLIEVLVGHKLGERGREKERERGREGEKERGREGERERGREGERERGREGERMRWDIHQNVSCRLGNLIRARELQFTDLTCTILSCNSQTHQVLYLGGGLTLPGAAAPAEEGVEVEEGAAAEGRNPGRHRAHSSYTEACC